MKDQDLVTRAKFFARVIGLLFAKKGLSGGKLERPGRGARHLSLPVRLANPLELDAALNLADNIALASNTEAVLAQRFAGLVVYQFQLHQGLWEEYTRSILPGPKAVGLAEQRRPVEFQFDPPHALVAGTTGSGKTETIRSVLCSLMTTYTPDEMGIIICDPKREKMHVFDNAAHLAIDIAYDRDDCKAAIAYTYQLLDDRIQGQSQTKRICLIIDEPDLIPLEGETLKIIQDVAKVGRSYGVHVIIGTQKPTHEELPKILDNLLNRFIGLVADGRVSAQLTGHAGLFAHKLTGKGDFIHVANGKSTRFQVATATRADFDKLERSEIKPIPKVNEQPIDVRTLPALVERSPVGRPSTEIDPQVLAWYLFHEFNEPGKISRNVARETMGLTRTSHELHQNLAEQVIVEYLRLHISVRQICGG